MADANDFSAPYVQFEGAGASSGISRRRERWGWWRACLGASQHEARVLTLPSAGRRSFYAANVVVNTKYNLLSFIPKVLYEQFRYFFNLYFLLVACSQFFPPLQIGLLVTYIAPLGFVLAVTMVKEGYDDFKRYRTDLEINHELYTRVLTGGGHETIRSQDIRVGHILRLQANQRVPADVLLLRTSESSGVIFLRTDQLDGETDWKLRLAVPACQKLPSDEALSRASATVYIAPPSRDIYAFEGDLTLHDEAVEGGSTVEPLALENTLWSNTVLASGSALVLVMYTGIDTRCAMNTSPPPSKVATLDLQVNLLAKVLFALTAGTALAMVAVPFIRRAAMYGIYVSDVTPQLLQALLDLARFMLLFSSIIPISLRVALDMAKLVYKVQMTSDARMPGLQVRSSTLPEELGGIDFLLTDKTGTLTRNEMIFRKLHLGFAYLSPQNLAEVQAAVAHAAAERDAAETAALTGGAASGGRGSFSACEPNPGAVNHAAAPAPPARAVGKATPQSESAFANAVYDAVLAIALCHNVAPVESSASSAADGFQGASPDELSLVMFAARCGVVLHERTPSRIVLHEPSGRLRCFQLLHEMPFSSELKRMGVLLRDESSGAITFLVKGAESVMAERIAPSDWMEEEVGNLAREGLRTLVVAARSLTKPQYDTFARAMAAAQLSRVGRAEATRAAFEILQEDMRLLCVTAVEDRLQANVRATLETLRDANVRTWMLTGDKLETAWVIAQNSSLVARRQRMYQVSVRPGADAADAKKEARQALNGYPQGKFNAPCLVLDGAALSLCVAHHQRLFMEVACAAPAVLCCRCTPTQKAEIVRLIRQTQPGACTAAIGDGGNDVGMIQAAHVGIGIEGREGRQAALAADFSLKQFSHLGRLVLWHGRNCYLRSATLSQFVIHRGLIISVIQAVFSSLFYFAPVALYDGILVAGYATVFTYGPVFSLVLDEDVSELNALKFPELYRELQKRRYLSIKTFLVWTWKALYQGCVIMLGGIVLFEERFVHVVGITFTALILTELIMVAVEVKRWHPLMLLAQVLTLLVYLACIVALSSPDFLGGSMAIFDIRFMLSVPFACRAAILTAASTVPIWFGKACSHYCAPRVVSKLS